MKKYFFILILYFSHGYSMSYLKYFWAPISDGINLFYWQWAQVGDDYQTLRSLILSERIPVCYQVNGTHYFKDLLYLMAMHVDDVEVIKKIIEKIGPISTIQLVKPFKYAVNSNNFTVAQYLIDRFKIPVDQIDAGETPLSFVSTLWDKVDEQKSERAVKWLLQKGANIHAKNDAGYTPLNFACFRGNLNVTKILVKNNALINDDESPALWCALRDCRLNERNWLPLIVFLLESGAQINYRNSLGMSILHAACRSRAPKEIIETLLYYGAKKNVIDSMGYLPINDAYPETKPLLIGKNYLHPLPESARKILLSEKIVQNKNIVLMLRNREIGKKIKQ